MPNGFHACARQSRLVRRAFSSLALVIVPEESPQNTLLLVDGSSYLYRAYHALPELRSPKTGEPTGAIYGVLNMLRKLATDYKAQAWAAVFDAKGRTFRDDVYPEYKATRSAMPDDLRSQVEPLYQAVRALGWPFLCVEGVEADDVIGTLVEEARKRGWRSVISTGDKDLTQLVDERTLWINTMSNEKLDIEGVTKKFGVPPGKIVDYLALIGDTIDNIPGVDKVGPKTACKWIVQYGSLEGVIAHADEISGLAGENLRKVKDWLPKARELLTVKRDVPLPISLEQLTDGKRDPARQRAQYERFGFKTWLKEVEDAPLAPASAPAEAVKKRRYRTILTEDELREVVLKIEAVPLVGLACLGSAEDPLRARLVGMALAFGDEAVYLPLAHQYAAAPAQVPMDTALALLKPWLEQADCILALHDILQPRIAADEKLAFVYERIELPLVPVLLAMERHGVLIDRPKLEAQSQELGKEILAFEQKAYDAAGQPFNLGSPKQIQEILFERQKLPVKKKTPSGQPSTDEDSLAERALDHPLPRLILEHRALSKLKSTYTDKLPKSINPATGRVHTTYSQTTAVTGRLASNEPNLQNIPIRTPAGRRIRACFIAPPGAKLMSADYSQIELRIMAHLSGDENLRRAFRDGEDVHRATAGEVFGVPLTDVDSDQRRIAKVINFGLIYGMSSFGVAQNLGIDRGTAQTYIERYFARYPGAKRYMDETRRRARELGYVETVFGRRLWLPALRSGAPVRRQAAERAAINEPMQGTAADLIKLAMIAVHGWLEESGSQAKLIMQVHDELVLEVPDAEVGTVRERVRELMQAVHELNVPLVVDVGVADNWDQAH